MKKVYALALVALLALPAFANAATPAPTFEGPGVKGAVTYNNTEKITFVDGKTYVKGGKTFVPVRELTEKFNLHIGYDAATHTAYILDKADATLVKAEKGEGMNLYRNGVKLKTTVEINAENKSFIPAADFAAALGKYYYEDTLSNSLYMFDDAAEMKDGEYVAVGLADARGWAPQVNLTVKGGKVASVEYNEFNTADGRGKVQDEAYLTNFHTRMEGANLPAAVANLQEQLVKKQDAFDVDAVSKSTQSSEKFVELSKKAMAQAKAAKASQAVNFEYRDGKYVVVGITAGNGWTPQLDMVVEGGKIVSAEYTAYDADGASKRLDGAEYLTRWTARYPDTKPVAIITEREAQLVKTQDPNMVDVATGATGWGSDLKIFAVGALNQARMATDIEISEDSTIYVFHGAPTANSAYYVQLMAIEKDGKIVDVDYVEYQIGEGLAKPHNPAYLERWAGRTPDVLLGRNQLDIRTEMLEFFMNNKSVEGIDTITGATNWRKGIVDLGPKALKMIEKK